jgi:uncharacterized protein
MWGGVVDLPTRHITIAEGNACEEGGGEAIEYAVKMWRLPDGALLRQRLESETLTTDEVQQRAETIANFSAKCNSAG